MGEWEFAARHHLTASDAQTLTIAELLAMADPQERAEFEELPLSYTPTWGTPALLDAIADTYLGLGPKHVLTFAGAEEAMFWALQELVGPGEHAVVTVPNYQSMESLTIATGADVDGLIVDPGDDWALDLETLTRLLRPTTRLVCINFPNNPTGALPDPHTFKQLVQLCDERGIRLFSDEVYRGLELDRAAMLPQAAELSPSAISLNVMSKSYGLPGLRIGWLATRDRKLLERLERRKHYTSIANAAPSELLATIALKHRDTIQARNREIIAANVPVLDAFFAQRADRFEWSPPQGGCVCFPRLKTGEDAGPFCRELVREAGVLLLPAEIYASRLGEVPRDRFRIGVGRHGLADALDAFDGFLSAVR
ncbi:MAG TPA: aminotransferase class I/II-fold pyridoxal phosphate-dependent enzyme [Solirubrobacteraceae bacterium]|nr:aminotransferase class I/II-fold pyridoxal phosphate-dependent enzyme [Solirubrobacteraceae bacterium]